MDILAMLAELQKGKEVKGSFIINALDGGDVQVTLWLTEDDAPIVEVVPSSLIQMLALMAG